ncbi:bifunctional diaminohydroxyphosphoribosylaminopyrimidine deaminase/5-amino-6-(5-phosphoribosylamino)uracil reductase RibD [Candidatus Peribacteria bacterium]|nr:bifunctional diaminohydroxyphosphoribosylaminopyrimidine deaminase/5-amino-6-(5-phosphoribosylamino)uracil reductase RibD [Candidatus Peribacteria bacterium]MBT4021571.1 bifunctional diaminohydroxyphosphoribosylaminopyrimidine deaminase/5-amino-6-(5-phosphoribosylamino)uracil reductase RibD [Candidatus Peribacteria bacterium]MBT4240731.1 bifunctional diaminohydroxyphosphoribosylaminopyrimidine deaminase/5-amino-6-(5-phosphoribosylamino)uracil reductase RibD [Candidatus Peribacteria bacterium]
MHYHFISRCLELAENGRGKVSPNPLVGCVIVKGGSVLTEGWHSEFGEEHAELSALRKAGDLARGGTLYTNIEPCCKQGKQPPCTDAIIRAGISTVVFGARDKSNSGSNSLRQNGIEVIGPIAESLCRRFNRGFFSLSENGRPWVTIKKALTKDMKVAHEHVTSQEQDEWSHMNLRAQHDAILVGAGTVVADDPELNVRFGIEEKRDPIRIILDPNSKVPTDSKVLTDSDADRTIVVNEKMPIPDLMELLKEKGISSVLVEGGPKVWESFEKSRIYNEMISIVEDY